MMCSIPCLSCVRCLWGPTSNRGGGGQAEGWWGKVAPEFFVMLKHASILPVPMVYTVTIPCISYSLYQLFTVSMHFSIVSITVAIHCIFAFFRCIHQTQCYLCFCHTQHMFAFVPYEKSSNLDGGLHLCLQPLNPITSSAVVPGSKQEWPQHTSAVGAGGRGGGGGGHQLRLQLAQRLEDA